MNTEHTPGPWRVGNGSFVISDHPAPGITGSDDVHHYGGHLICESVSQANARLIAAAPDLLEALKILSDYPISGGYALGPCISECDMQEIRAAIAKAEGKA
jgi:hypothetical protein